MDKICWICEAKPADSREHMILKSALKEILGKASEKSIQRISYIEGKKNIPLKSHKNKHLTFDKSICEQCNNTLTQPYDAAFLELIRYLKSKKQTVIARNKLHLNSVYKKDDRKKKNLALYIIKILGCLIKESCHPNFITSLPVFARSLRNGEVSLKGVYVSFHRDLQKLAFKRKVHVSQQPVVRKNFIGWIIDLDWISMTITYPTASPETYGESWELSEFGKNSLKFGKFK